MRPHNRQRPRPPLLTYCAHVWVGETSLGTRRTFVCRVRSTSEAGARFKALDKAREHGYSVTLGDIKEMEYMP